MQSDAAKYIVILTKLINRRYFAEQSRLVRSQHLIPAVTCHPCGDANSDLRSGIPPPRECRISKTNRFQNARGDSEFRWPRGQVAAGALTGDAIASAS